MATKIYKSEYIHLIDGTELYITPLKIKYLREFMDEFDKVKDSKGDMDTIEKLAECSRIAMKQYHPPIKTIEQLEDSVNVPTIYKIIEIAGGIKINPDKKDEETQEDVSITDQAQKPGFSWEDFDLAKIETEVFQLGIWKDYEELESSLSMPELMETLSAKRELDYQEKKFLAAMQGVDLDNNNGESANAWEKMKAKVAAQVSGTGTEDPNDIASFQGVKAQQAGFGIGMGLSYEKI